MIRGGFSALVFVAILVVSCKDRVDMVPSEVVLVEGMSVRAVHDDDWVCVSYIDPATRRIECNMMSRTVAMVVRRERFSYPGIIGEGILGIYEPGDTRSLFAASGNVRLVYSEEEHRFKEEAEMQRFLIQGSAAQHRVCTIDGLVVSFNLKRKGGVVEVEVMQLYVDNQKPTLKSGSGVYELGLQIFTEGVGTKKPGHQ